MVATVFLEMEGEFEVTAVERGSEAVAAAIANPPDVILLDYMMPGMNGPETFAALRANERTRSIPVIFLTGMSDAEVQGDLLAAGARGFIQKPFNPDTFSADVMRVLRSSQ